MTLPAALPDEGMGPEAALALMGTAIEARAVRLDLPHAFAHMDPPPDAVAAALAGRMAARNENMLHPDLSPLSTEAERRVIGWLAPAFGMAAGHMTGGSTLSNLAALWAAREHGARRVVASAEAHLSVPKAAHLLGMAYEAVPAPDGRMDADALPSLADTALVLTAGTTGRGAVDPLHLRGAWTHVDAAWAGPMRLSRHAGVLDGVEGADSVAISAHKWLWQPKESALVLFRDPAAQAAISFGGAYLAAPNVGVQGSRGGAAVPLLGTLLSLGRRGVAARIERGMADAQALADWLAPRVALLGRPVTGVVNWRAEGADMDGVLAALGPAASRLTVGGEVWARHVAANPSVDLGAVTERIAAALEAAG